ncbi:CBS domain-containing protein [Caldivirga sp. UBA161]|uniref:CBS domain-containing protein n=1 Tax=Caldivirga sp. UBA161 TaxID=1915569 RepID=UPI0025BC6420|nr:CBS domain-containing protein [Caldivirga sp. UBA161]
MAITFTALFFPLAFRLRYGRPKAEGRRVNLIMPIREVITKGIFASCNDNLRYVVNLINENRVRAVVVIDEEQRPRSIITITTLLEIDPNEYERLRVCDVQLDDIEVVNENVKVGEVLRRFRETETSVIAVIDKEGKLLGVVYERELLRKIMEA